MAWWQIWNWFRLDNNHSHGVSRPSSRTGGSGDFAQAELKQSEDILMSISRLIEDQPSSTGNTFRPIQVLEAIAAVEAKPSIDPIPPSVPAEPMKPAEAPPAPEVAGTLQPAKISAAIQATTANSDPARAKKPPMPKREESGKEIRRTLVADEGQWSILKGLSERFDDEDEDDDDSDGQSGKKTIVPKED